MRLYVSKLRQYRSCQLKGHWLAELPKEKRDQATDSAGNRYGKAAHGVLEDVYGWVKATGYGGPMHSPDVMARAFDAIGRRCAEYEIDAEAAVQLEESIIDYLAEQHHVDGSDILGVEHFLQFKTKAGHQVVGVADRIDRLNSSAGPMVRIVDYKSGESSMGPDEVAANDQAQTYVAAALQFYPWATRLQFRLEFLGSRSSAAYTWARTEAAWMSTRIAQQYDEEARGMEVAPWLPNTGRHCQRCPFRGFCPAQDGASDGSDIPESFYNPMAAPSPTQPTLL